MDSDGDWVRGPTFEVFFSRGVRVPRGLAACMTGALTQAEIPQPPTPSGAIAPTLKGLTEATSASLNGCVHLTGKRRHVWTVIGYNL
jgi:hypothetical protein